MKTVRSVERAISVLMFIAENPNALGLSEISRNVRLDKATTLRLIATAPVSLPKDAFSALFPRVDWKGSLPELRRKGAIDSLRGPLCRVEFSGLGFQA